jgi:hypothetical protein
MWITKWSARSLNGSAGLTKAVVSRLMSIYPRSTYLSSGAGVSKTSNFVLPPTFLGSATCINGIRLCPGDGDFTGHPGGRLSFDDFDVLMDIVGEYTSESRALVRLLRCILGESISRVTLSPSFSLSIGGGSGLVREGISSGVDNPSLNVSWTPDINCRTLPVLKRLDHEARLVDEPDDEREAASVGATGEGVRCCCRSHAEGGGRRTISSVRLK